MRSRSAEMKSPGKEKEPPARALSLWEETEFDLFHYPGGGVFPEGCFDHNPVFAFGEADVVPPYCSIGVGLAVADEFPVYVEFC